MFIVLERRHGAVPRELPYFVHVETGLIVEEDGSQGRSRTLAGCKGWVQL